MTDRLLNPAEAALALGISSGTLANWRTQRRGPRHVKVGALVRYDPADLRDYLNANRSRDESEPESAA
jgi:predicted DNA-binding transcriptional regulator AlpA